KRLGHIDLLLFGSGVHIAGDVQVVIVLLDFKELHHSTVLGHGLITSVCPHDFLDILRPELILLLALQIILRAVYEKYRASSLSRLVLVDDQYGRRYARAIKELSRQADHSLDDIL